MRHDYATVTEISGEPVSTAQVERLAQRYYWAAEYCRGKDVLEIACGSGQGLGYLASVARSVAGGDITPSLVEQAVKTYGSRLHVSLMDAERLPFPNQSLDVVILFEALYYLPSGDRFVQEARRVLRPGGMLLIASANKDLFDFNPSPFSVTYYGVVEMAELLHRHGFSARFFAGAPASQGGLAHTLIRVTKKTVVALHLMPKTMRGKRLLKRIVFGKLIPMPAEVPAGLRYEAPVAIDATQPDTTHQVIFSAATRS